MDLGKPIAYGRTADIHAWQEGQILKLFHDWFSLEDIQYEQRIGRAIESSGLPVPRVGEIVQVNGRNGLVYQRVDGRPMLAMMRSKPWNGQAYARKMADLHARMHASDLRADLPRLDKRLAYKINDAAALPAGVREEMLERLAGMPPGGRLCHGDFHPDNILMTRKEDVIIDWIDSTLGNPLADVARTTIIILGAVDGGQIRNPFEKLFLRLFHRDYLRHYFVLCPGGEEEYIRWLPIVAAGRLSENIKVLEDWLLAKAGVDLVQPILTGN